MNFTGWRYDRENQAAILSRSMNTYVTWRKNLLEYDWEPPAEWDPRHWFDIESQGNIGSCQGNAMASAVEHAYMLKYGPEIQLSRFWSYVTSQEEDGISGDQGSTLDGGGRAVAKVGICKESSFPYPRSYQEGMSFYRSNRSRLLEEAAQFKLKGEVPIATWDDAVAYLKSLAGSIQTGIMWGSSMDRGWEITSYSPGSGGHSTLIPGFLKVESWEDGIGLLMKNSWGTGWGREGWCLINKRAFEQMLRTRWNIFVGRSESESPAPQPVPDV